MEVLVVVQNHVELVRLVKMDRSFLQGKLQDMAALFPVVGDEGDDAVFRGQSSTCRYIRG